MLKKEIMLSIFFISFLVFSSVNAAEDLSNDNVSLNNSAIGLSVAESIDNYENLASNPNSLSNLNTLINNNSDFNIYLTEDYCYNPETDYGLENGIVISRSINIYGNGHTIDGKNKVRLFYVTNYVNFNNIRFINANSDSGSAITGSNYAVSNSYFINDHASKYGGAMNGGYATNCVFEGNTAVNYGGAIYTGSVDNCTFSNNSALEGGAINDVYATNSLFISNYAGKYGGAMYGSSAGYCTFTGNSAKERSGAVYNAYVIGCTFINNTANNGGAIGGTANSAQDCIFIGNHAVNFGGATYGYAVYNSQFRLNYADKGGASYTGSVNNCVFENNSAIHDGGAILDAYAVNCNFTYNTANRGGAMFQNSARNCNFFYNSADYGGAIYNAHSDSCKFRYNTAKVQGGAIDEGGSESSDFRYNSAPNGGAVSLTDVIACTFIENTASDYGGAAYKTSARRSYFGSNTAKFGGALAVDSSASECVFKYNVAKITGGAKYDAYVADSEFEGNLPTYTLKVSDFTGIYGFGGDIHIELYDSPDYPVTGVNATIKVYNSKNAVIGTYKSEVGYNWFVNLPAGKYKAQITVDDDCYEIDPIKISISILKSSSIYVVDVTTNYNAGKVLLVNLHDANGALIKYAKVSVNLNGVTQTYVTDSNGQAMVPTKSLIPKTYVATIVFAGDSTYVGTSATAKIIVKKLTPKLTASKITFKFKDKTKKYVVTLKDNKGAAMKSTKITVKVNGKTYSAKTGSKGKATFKLKALKKKKTYSAVVTYAGSSIYNSVKKTVKMIVK